MEAVIGAVLILLAMGVVLGLVIGVAAKVFAVEIDPRIEQIEELLPSANCGACGFAGCADFARALVAGQTTPDVCPSTAEDEIARIAALLGVDVGARDPKVAVIRCAGDDRLTKKTIRYNGVADCRSANPVAGGPKACRYGCTGLGTCARVCPFNAIEITAQNLAVVHPDICTGCGKCVAGCPRDLIVIVPKSAPLHVLCNNPEKGAACNKVCSVACIGCRKCVKEAAEGQMTMDGFLAAVNYDNPPGAELCDVCPTKCLQPSLLVGSNPPAPQAEEEVANG